MMHTRQGMTLSLFSTFFAVAVSMTPLAGASARACLPPDGYSFAKIADTGPESPFSDLPIGQAINNLGMVAFVATSKSGGSAIYRAREGDLVTIARTGEDDISVSLRRRT